MPSLRPPYHPVFEPLGGLEATPPWQEGSHVHYFAIRPRFTFTGVSAGSSGAVYCR